MKCAIVLSAYLLLWDRIYSDEVCDSTECIPFVVGQRLVFSQTILGSTPISIAFMIWGTSSTH